MKGAKKEVTQASKVSRLARWKYDAQKDCFYCSKEFSRIFGIEDRDIKKDLKSLLMLIDPDDRLKALDAVTWCLEGEDMQVECRILQHNCGKKSVWVEGTPYIR